MPIKFLFCALLAFSSLLPFNANPGVAQNSQAFKFNPARLRTGALYQRKSNVDGTRPDNIFIYQKLYGGDADGRDVSTVRR